MNETKLRWLVRDMTPVESGRIYSGRELPPGMFICQHNSMKVIELQALVRTKVLEDGEEFEWSSVEVVYHD